MTFSAGVVSSVNRALAELAPNRAALRSPREIIKSVEVRDVLFTALLAFLAMLAYMAPLYDDTYGSGNDYLTAFIAGFGTQAVVQWALLPAFQSLRNRVAKPANGGMPSGDEAGVGTVSDSTENED